MDPFTYQSRIDGWTIHAYRWTQAEARGLVVISHGMAEHAHRYNNFAKALNMAGFEVWAMDHRAHGKTSGPTGLGDFGEGGWDALVADIEQLIDLAAETTGLNVSVFAHSMGAAAAQQLVQTASHKVHALVLSGSTARRPGEQVGDFNSPFEPARTPYDWLSRDSVEVDAYISDPLCGFEGQTVKNGFQRDDHRRTNPDLIVGIRNDLPVLLLAGDADPINRQLRGLYLLESLWRQGGVQDITRHYYADGRHEMLNETNRDEVQTNVIGWLTRQYPSLDD